MVSLSRVATFCASHRYHNPAFSDQENLRIFGKCNYEHGHGHNYRLEITVAGEVNPDTGMVINLSELDSIIKAEVIEPLDHRYLNLDVPEFAETIPTTENIAAFIWARVDKALTGCRLQRLKLYESEDLFVEIAEGD